MSIKTFLVLLSTVVLMGCGGQSGGLAPSREEPAQTPPVVETSGDSNFKYGETVTTSNSWEVSLDTTDPVENVTLVNGWNVEVKYE